MIVIRIGDESEGESMQDPERKPLYEVRMQSLITVDDGDGGRRYSVTHVVTRFADGSWKVAVNRNGRQYEMTGDGVVPGFVDADGAVVIVVPFDAQNRPPSPTASS